MNEPVALKPTRHFEIEDDLTDASFDRIAAIAYDRAGLFFPRIKKSMVKSRMARRLRDLRMPSFEGYTRFVCSTDGEPERHRLVGALTTNVSNFFRENHHFDLLRTTILPPLLARLAHGEKVRIWSAGCANGQEAYSIAILLNEMVPKIQDWDIRILATDIDGDVLAFAKAAIYPDHMIETVPAAYKAKYFRESGSVPGGFRLNRQVAQLVTFNTLNLHDPWPMKGLFDVIFCRNVLIYFDEAAQGQLLARFHTTLTQDGWMVLGHSERVPPSQASAFKSAGVTTLRKSGA